MSTPNVSRAQASIQRSPDETIQRDVDSEVQRWADDAPDFDAEPLTPAPHFDAPSDVQDAGDSSASFDTGGDFSSSDTPNVSRAQAPIQRSPDETIQRDVDSESPTLGR